ncbi:hypothetical protein U1Q18_030361 [Sarracenia purpurea var. burkii]
MLGSAPNLLCCILPSNAIKFTHEGKVGIKLYVLPAPSCGMDNRPNQKISTDKSTFSENVQESDECLSLSQCGSDPNGFHGSTHQEGPCKSHTLDDEPKTPIRNGASTDGGEENHPYPHETTVWICCDVYDTGIGIPENALSTLFKKYTQVSADTARKYGGTGLGLAICKQLVELIGGHLTVTSQEHHGSIFTFVLPYKVSLACDNSDEELSDMADHDALGESNDDDTSSGFFQFQPRTLGTLFSSGSSIRTQKLLPNSVAFNPSHKLNGLPEDPYSFPIISIASKEVLSLKDSCSMADDAEKSSEAEENGNPPMVSTYSSRTATKVGETIKQRASQEASERKERSNRSSQCTSSNCPESTKSTSKPKILLVEDNKINVMVTKSMMKQLGHIIDVVNNGVEAVCAVQNCSYDLILMDVCMPIMDGLQATRLIRSFEEAGNWDAAVEAGIEQHMPPNSSPKNQESSSSRNRVPIVAVSS